MKNKKVTLWCIIVLLILFLPITIFSTSMHYIRQHQQEVNVNHDFKFNGKLYFYDNNQLLGTYTCQNYDGYCDYALPSTKSDFPLNEPKVEKNTKLPIINNRYVFLMDAKTEEINNTKIYLYDLTIEKVLGTYREVKNYGIGIENDYYMLKNQDNLWGVVEIGEEIVLKIPFQYDYIGLIDKIDPETKKVASDIFAAYKNKQWQLVDSNKATFAANINEDIFSYNNEYIVLTKREEMKLTDYRGNVLLSGYKYINFYNKFLEIIDNNNEFYLYDLTRQTKISNSYTVTGIEDIELKTEENQIKIILNDKVEETIAIQ